MSAALALATPSLPPFAKQAIPGLDLWRVAEGFDVLAPFSETTRATLSAERITDHTDTKRNPGLVKSHLGWGEIRADNMPGRAFTVTVTTAGAAPHVYIAACDVNNSAKITGFARATLAFAAHVAAPLDADITVCATDDGAAAWLALGGQPGDDDYEQLLRKLRHQRTSYAVMDYINQRDFVGLRKRSVGDFVNVVEQLRPWDGGWSAEQVKAIAAANEGLR